MISIYLSHMLSVRALLQGSLSKRNETLNEVIIIEECADSIFTDSLLMGHAGGRTDVVPRYRVAASKDTML